MFMKKLCLFILAMMLLFPSAMFAVENDVKIGNLWYNLIDKAKVAEVTDWDRYVSYIIIPSNVDYNGKTYKVERIREEAFHITNNKHDYREKGKKDLKSVQLPEGLIEICENAFDGCSYLESINIPQTLLTIGQGAFSYCSKLSTPIVLNNIERIEDQTFEGCSMLESVTLSNSTTYIGSYAFYDCEKLKSIIIPNKVTTIGSFAFSGCHSLKSVYIPASVIHFGNKDMGEPFIDCKNMEEIVVDPNNLMYDSRNNCNAIIISGLNRLISGCQNTKIPNGIWEIGEYAFWKCVKLKAIDIPSSVYSIGDAAFQNCEELTSVTFHGDLSSFGWSVFKGCKSLKSIELPNGVEDLSYTFEDCINLQRVKLPNTVTKLHSAFYNCTNLTEFNIPERVSSIWDFDNCKKIKSFPLHNNSGLSGFNDCDNLETVYLSSSMLRLSNSFKNCKSLLDVYCYAVKPPYIYEDDKSFSGSDIKYSTLHVPAQSVEQYSNATKWNEFGKIVGFEPQIISVNEALSILQEIESQCKSEDTLIDNLIENSNKSVMGYGYLSSSTTYPYKYDLKDFLSIVQSCINEINKSQTTDYYQIENIKHLWDNTYSVMGQKYRNILEECLNNLVYVNFKCNAGGKIVFGYKYYDGNEIQNNSENFSFYNPTLIRNNIFALYDVFALPYDGYHVQSFKVGGVDVLGISNIFEYQYSYETKKGYSFPFSYQNVEVIFASGESSIQSVRVDGKSNSVYSINGIKVRENTTSLDGLPKGIYIVDGKKVVVK
jgi:hypothetical protein